MPKSPKRSKRWSGSVAEALDWSVLVEIFDSLIGSSLRSLPKYPEVIGFTNAFWHDAKDNSHEVDTLDELQDPYEQQVTSKITFSHSSDGTMVEFVYTPGDPRPRAAVMVSADPDSVEAMIAPLAVAFPDPYSGLIIFLSWSGAASRSVAEVLRTILQVRLPSSEVFFSPTSIDPGDDPLMVMFEENLRHAEILVAVLTQEAANSPWVIWETASAWATDRLVIPIFVNISPDDIPGPLRLKLQGERLDQREDVDRAVSKIMERTSRGSSIELSDQEWDALTAASRTPEIGSTHFPARFQQRTVRLSDGTHPGTQLAILVSADVALGNCRCTMSWISGPPGVETIPAPARLTWYPSDDVAFDVAQGASELIRIARVGPYPPFALIDCPDNDLPWSLPNGAWRFQLQITANGYSAQVIEGAFNVVPVAGTPNQGIEWTELTVTLES
jgi:hypothetical protein